MEFQVPTCWVEIKLETRAPKSRQAMDSDGLAGLDGLAALGNALSTLGSGHFLRPSEALLFGTPFDAVYGEANAAQLAEAESNSLGHVRHAEHIYEAAKSESEAAEEDKDTTRREKALKEATEARRLIELALSSAEAAAETAESAATEASQRACAALAAARTDALDDLIAQKWAAADAAAPPELEELLAVAVRVAKHARSPQLAASSIPAGSSEGRLAAAARRIGEAARAREEAAAVEVELAAIARAQLVAERRAREQAAAERRARLEAEFAAARQAAADAVQAEREAMDWQLRCEEAVRGGREPPPHETEAERAAREARERVVAAEAEAAALEAAQKAEVARSIAAAARARAREAERAREADRREEAERAAEESKAEEEVAARQQAKREEEERAEIERREARQKARARAKEEAMAAAAAEAATLAGAATLQERLEARMAKAEERREEAKESLVVATAVALAERAVADSETGDGAPGQPQPAEAHNDMTQPAQTRTAAQASNSGAAEPTPGRVDNERQSHTASSNDGTAVSPTAEPLAEPIEHHAVAASSSPSLPMAALGGSSSGSSSVPGSARSAPNSTRESPASRRSTAAAISHQRLERASQRMRPRSRSLELIDGGELLPAAAPVGDADEAFQGAARDGDLAAVVAMLHEGASVRVADAAGMSPLHWACEWPSSPHRHATPCPVPFLFHT